MWRVSANIFFLFVPTAKLLLVPSFQKHDSCPILMHVILKSLVHHWIQFSVFFLYLFGSSAEMRWVEFLRLKGQAFELLRYEIPDLWSFLRKRQLVWSDRRWLMFGSAEKCLFTSPHQTGQFFLSSHKYWKRSSLSVDCTEARIFLTAVT